MIRGNGLSSHDYCLLSYFSLPPLHTDHCMFSSPFSYATSQFRHFAHTISRSEVSLYNYV
jgi:hypothetical protein